MPVARFIVVAVGLVLMAAAVTSRAQSASSQLVFTSNRGGNLDIYVMNDDGSDVVQLTNDPRVDADPAWSPDGRRIAFASDRDGDFEIFVMNADGTGVVQVTHTDASGQERRPKWSPDGRFLVFHRPFVPETGFHVDLYLVELATGSITRLTFGGGFSSGGGVPDWAPEASIIFQRHTDGSDWELAVRSSGGTVTQLTNNNREDIDPDWFPGGTRAAFIARGVNNLDEDIWAIELATRTQTQLTSGPAREGGPSVSCDGSRMAFNRLAQGEVNHDIWVMAAGGTGQLNISNHPATDHSPDWRCSHVPVANAGPDQTVNEDVLVMLDGSASTGRDLTFEWRQIAGPDATLDDPTSATPSFTAPQLPGGFGSQVLTFELTVTSATESSTDTVDVTVVNVNRAPVAEAGGDQTVNEGSSVSLDGSASFDPDEDPFTHAWEQTGGTEVELTGADTAAPSFTSPLLAGGFGSIETLTFELTVFDGALSSTDTVQVIVEQVNHAPVANAGVDQTVNEGVLVTLDGSASSDPDGDPIASYAWTQLGEPPVALSNADSATPSFTAPVTGPGGATLVFELTVSDGLLFNEPAAAEPDERVTINAVNVNDPPLCSAARASPSLLWPPNHKLVPVGIHGLADPNDDDVQITIMGVTQDEPANGLGDGDTSPDAVIRGDTALLRAERSGDGNGRIYRIEFIASDDQGGSCAGSVQVGVPLSMKRGAAPVDDGELYDSTQP